MYAACRRPTAGTTDRPKKNGPTLSGCSSSSACPLIGKQQRERNSVVVPLMSAVTKLMAAELERLDSISEEKFVGVVAYG